MIRDKKILITGGAGFVGAILIKNLIKDNQITVVDNFSRDALSQSAAFSHPNLRIENLDVTLSSSFQHLDTDFEIIIHLAAIAGIDAVIADPIRTMEVNFLGAMHVLKFAATNTRVSRVVIFSTSEIYGSDAFNKHESDNAVTGTAGEARWSYAVSKLSSEHLAMAYFHKKQLPIVIIRPFNIYGPGQVGEGAIHKFITQAVSNETISIDGNGSQVRAWCYVDDFIQGVLLSMTENSAVGEAFNIGNSETALSILDLAKLVIRKVNSTSQIVHEPALSADIAIRVPTTLKATELLGFTAKIGLEEGILETAEWVKGKLDDNRNH